MLLKSRVRCRYFCLSLFTTTLLASGLAQAEVNLPDIGTTADQVFSPAQEQELGQAFVRQLRQQAKVIDASEVSAYLNALGARLAAHSENPMQPFEFIAIDDNSINAFAVPGGFIGVHSGLILSTRDESELASVLAHEIAHVTQRHIARTVEGTSRFSVASVAAMLAAILVGMKNPEVAQAGVTAVMAGNIQMQIDFTRTHEKEADRLGMETLAGAGFSPQSMPSFFERLQGSSRLYEGNVPEFLRTHPVTTDRIAEARDRAEQYADSHPATAQTDSSDYHLMRAKILVATHKELPKLIKQLEASLESGKYRDARAVHYGLALARLASNNPAGVQAHLDWLQAQDGDRVVYRLAAAQLAMLNKADDQAARIFAEGLKVYPGDTTLSMAYAQLLLNQAQAAQAAQVLENTEKTNHPGYYQLLAQAQQALGDTGTAHLSMAEFYYQNGQTGLAVEQLKQARRLSLSFYLASRVEARLLQLETELREEKADKKKQGKDSER